jgi:hypothetical protein
LARFWDEERDDQLGAEEEGEGLQGEEAGAGEGVGVEYLWVEIVLMTAFECSIGIDLRPWLVVLEPLARELIFVLWQGLMGFLLLKAF